jgi:ABC-2 type transport system ATP-binding protein
MPADAEGRIEIHNLTKRFGHVLAVDNLSFTVEPGRVTGFLGPNGAGKTTTFRVLLGLVKATAGGATIAGRRYRDLSEPQRAVGALLEASNFHPGRSGRDHLRVLASTAGVAPGRVDEVLHIVGLTEHGGRRAGGYSMGMRQRLGLAGALLGDPRVIVLDEPANGLDPEGIRWMRGFLRSLAAEGRTVLISSHVLSEVEQTVDDVVIIARGRLVHASPLAELAATASREVHVVSPDRDALLRALSAAGMSARPAEVVDAGPAYANGPATTDRAVLVEGSTPAEVGRAAFQAGIELHELRRATESLEETFLRLTSDNPERSVA